MSMTDPIADLLTRIRNVNVLGRTSVRAPYSRIKEQILMTLKREGFIEDYQVELPWVICQNPGSGGSCPLAGVRTGCGKCKTPGRVVQRSFGRA